MSRDFYLLNLGVTLSDLAHYMVLLEIFFCADGGETDDSHTHKNEWMAPTCCYFIFNYKVHRDRYCVFVFLYHPDVFSEVGCDRGKINEQFHSEISVAWDDINPSS